MCNPDGGHKTGLDHKNIHIITYLKKRNKYIKIIYNLFIRSQLIRKMRTYIFYVQNTRRSRRDLQKLLS